MRYSGRRIAAFRAPFLPLSPYLKPRFLFFVLAVAAACAPASAALSPAGSFVAIDRPDDDGTALLVTWSVPDNETKDAKYAVEVAASEADLEARRFKTVTVVASPKSLGAAKPEYFGHGARTKKTRFAEVFPAALFPPPEAPTLTPERLREFAADKVLTGAELDRALAIQAVAAPDNALTPRQMADREWFARLQDYLKIKDGERTDALKTEINRATYYFRLAVVEGDARTYVERDGRPVVVSARATANLFKRVKVNNLVFSLAFSAVVVAFIHVAKRRPGLFIRRIAGLDAINEAIGRATEMDRPVYFVHGLGGIGDLSTMASINILSEVARRTAEHDTRIRVMNNDALVTAVSQEVVQQSCTAAGRPDAYNADDVSLVASDQFSYVAAVSGNMVREQPGAIFMMGPFFAESLLLAETGASTGAIQVAGTDSYTQLPFFVTTCDYTLIGEELYAASAYLSRDPRLLGSLRGQDVGKAFLMIAIVGVTVVVTAAVFVGADFTWLSNLFEAL